MGRTVVEREGGRESDEGISVVPRGDACCRLL